MNLITALLVLVAAIPGIAGLWYAIKHGDPAPVPAPGNSATDSAVRSLESQIRRLNEEQRRAAIQRDVWELDRRELTHHLDVLTEKLNTLQTYVRVLITLLTANGIDHPRPPFD